MAAVRSRQARSAGVNPVATHSDIASGIAKRKPPPTKLECLHCAASRALLAHFRERLREAITTEEFLLARVAALEALLPRTVLDSAFPSSPSKGSGAPAADAIVDLQSCEASAIKPQQDSPVAVSSDKIVRARPHADHNAPAEEARVLWADRDPAASQATGPSSTAGAGAVAGGKGAASGGAGTLFTPDPTGPGAARTSGLGVRLHVDTSASSVADAGTSDTLMLLEQVRRRGARVRRGREPRRRHLPAISGAPRRQPTHRPDARACALPALYLPS